MTSHLKLCLALLLLPSSLVWSQEQSRTGVVHGRVLNVSRDSTAVPEQEVVLYQYVDGQEVEGDRPHTVTDFRGHFAFENLEIGERFTYYPLAAVAGIEYSGALVKPAPSALRQESDVLIFDSTTSDSAISTTVHHLILKPEPGAIAVRELFLFANRGNHTYVGNLPSGSKKNIVLSLEAPINATDVQFGGGLMNCCAVVKDNQIFDTMEFKPGTRQIVLNYRLPYEGEAASLIKTIAHATAGLDVFLPQGSGIISSPLLEEAAPFPIRDQSYLRYHAENLAPGARLSLAITNLPAAPRDYRMLAPVALILIIAAGYALHHRRNGRTAEFEQVTREMIPQNENDEHRH